MGVLQVVAVARHGEHEALLAGVLGGLEVHQHAALRRVVVRASLAAQAGARVVPHDGFLGRAAHKQPSRERMPADGRAHAEQALLLCQRDLDLAGVGQLPGVPVGDGIEGRLAGFLRVALDRCRTTVRVLHRLDVGCGEQLRLQHGAVKRATKRQRCGVVVLGGVHPGAVMRGSLDRKELQRAIVDHAQLAPVVHLRRDVRVDARREAGQAYLGHGEQLRVQA